RQGDTLWSLAVRFYGDGHRYRDILVANQTTIPDVEAIPIGTTILLPR
ncbi:MAG: LysM peptidoglycan-binding domain-containing protein, partial [Planctomycetota bacterium]